MPTIVRQFTGNMNLDASPFRTPSEDYIHALNITRDSEGELSDGPPTSIPGNQFVPYTLPEGICKCIGGYADTLTNREYYFIWNQNGNHSLIYYSKTSNSTVKVFENLTDSGGIDIFPLDPSFRISSVNILRRDEGDILYFVDGLTRPYKMNIDKLQSGYYGVVSEETIRTARMPPLQALNSQQIIYGSDATVVVNNFKRKLFQFIYRWVYEDGEKSTWSPISKCILPVEAGAIDTESDPTKNNYINIQLNAGPQDYKSIELAARECLGVVYGDFFLIDTIDRIDDNVPPGGTYNYIFFNDGAYTFLDPSETSLIFDWIPDIAQSQDLANGNVLLYANITDGYLPIPRQDISVILTSGLVDTTGNNILPSNPTISFGVYATFTEFIIGPSVGVGDTYIITFTLTDNRNGLSPVVVLFFNVSYVAVSGDTPNSVAASLRTLLTNQISSFGMPLIGFVDDNGNPTHISFNPFSYSGFKPIAQNVSATANSPVFYYGGSATWKWNSKYRFGLVYFDKYGKTNGVISFVTNNNDATDFAVTTPDFNYNSTSPNPDYLNNPQIPVIYASINHLPPSWAVKYQWVRTPNLTVSRFLEYITCDVQSDSDYYYFCIQNLSVFKTNNSGFVPNYTFDSGDRLRVYGGVLFPGYSIPSPVRDYEVLGTVQRNMTGGATPGLYLKVKKPTGGPSYSLKTMIELYRPATRSTEQGQVFFEFGESYDLYIDNGVRYHVGKEQNQNATQPATFTFADGDVYYKFRDFYGLTAGSVDPNTVYAKGIMDANYSDYFTSSVNSNGRPNVVDPNATRTTNSTLIRFGGAYQQGTDVNLINRFYPENFDEYDHNYGGVLRLHIRDRLMHVYQKTKVGKVPIYGQIVKDQSGGDQVLISDKLINPIQYYAGDYGIGDCPESLAWNNFTDYFVDDLRGVVCKLGQQGIEPISITKNMNSFFVKNLKGYREGLNNGYSTGIYMGNPTIIGAFDAFTNKYIIAMEEISRYDETGTQTFFQFANTIAFNERSNGFESFYSFHPDWVSCLDTLLISFKDGNLWTHDDVFPNVFYGTGYPSSITPVLNDNITDKKTWMNLTEQANVKWACPEISTSLSSSFGGNQVSNLRDVDFAEYEGEYNAAFLRETNSIGGINDGDVLKGNYMILKLSALPQNFSVFLNRIEVEYKDSAKNNR